VVSGAVVLGGRVLAAGSYAHIAPGVAHPMRADGDEGCVLLQLHQPDPR